jgi:hypothetical protein
MKTSRRKCQDPREDCGADATIRDLEAGEHSEDLEDIEVRAEVRADEQQCRESEDPELQPDRAHGEDREDRGASGDGQDSADRQDHPLVQRDSEDRETRAHESNQDDVVSVGVSSTGGSGQSIELRFHLAKDALRFQMFTLLTCIIVYAHAMTSCTMFFSSLYPVHYPALAAPPSAVDSFLMSSHILAIDISSAYFIIAGFFGAYTFANCQR